ncbi:sigma-70 family RNA polymerase sigma factor [Parabacteroides sp. BX2]|uniref:Sigma-70 family RNA polymerase sigma factor n=1 Tax=Parabacteroides segnis TaxID=2763058 RepID=A0ABR7DY44_9BACT|nr:MULTISPECIES: sigma-70 family RNA polymerase sigma factor [Parabacteroides]MBC5642422.1 sigma-70 family RNA polymerase sigma factor [Parabacteroides segnis]MCM0712185.1 sigma-70 family RNA polymerase sigma factor [Parabacteroides sp. TA-V-105]
MEINYNVSENILWMSFKNGDDRSFELIYRKYADALFRYGIQFTSNESLVKDAIHDVYVKLYNDRQHLKTEVNIKFYLFTCLKNHLYNLLKRELFFDKVDIEEYEYLDPGAEEQVTLTLNQSELQETVRKVLGMLTDRQREIIYYRYIEELSIEEIAVLMDMNYQSVQNSIQRSIKKIRESFPILAIFFILYKKMYFC